MHWRQMLADRITRDRVSHRLPYAVDQQQYSVRWACLVSLEPKREKNEVAFSTAIGSWELVHKCFLKHSHMGTVRMK